MSRDLALRASDDDRERTVELLREAHAAGQLDFEEFSERLDAALAARTRADLLPLTRDLHQRAVVPRGQAALARGSHVALKWSWRAYAVAVSINLLVWFLVSVTTGDPVYFWPAWVAGPWGAMLLTWQVMGPKEPQRRQIRGR